MYRFTNGLVFFTKEDADKAIARGYKLVEEKVKNDTSRIIEKLDSETKEKNRTNKKISK